MVIVGSGGFAEELVGWHTAEQLAGVDGYVGAGPNPAIPLPYLGTFEEMGMLKQSEFLLAVGTPPVRMKALEILLANNKKISSFVHATATLAKGVKLGQGIVIGPYCFVSTGAELGDFVFMNCYSSVGHHSHVGARSVLNPYSAVTGGCILGEDCQMGVSSSILPKVKLPSGTKVSPGASVYRSVREACTLMGVPARPIKGI